MIYYREKEPLIIPNYGRNVQLLVKYITDEIKDKKERTDAIETLVRQIAQQNPNMKNQPEYLQKIWGHLFIISEYSLDIDSPYPLPEKPKEQILTPKRIEYSKWPDPIDKLSEELEKGDAILITHHHKDHCKKVTVHRLKGDETKAVAPRLCMKELEEGVIVVEPGMKLD